jgi:hypothetical protein
MKLGFWKFYQTCLFGLLCAIFIIGTSRWAILQSKTQLADWMGNTGIMQNAAVLITVESMLGIAFCIEELRAMFGVKKTVWGRLKKLFLHVYPGLLLFPVLFYLQTQLIFALPGTNFAFSAYTFAAAIFIALPLFSLALKRICPEKELRLEVYFLINLFVCIIGLISTVNGNTTYSAVKEPMNIKAIALSATIFIIAFLLGFIINKYKWYIKK